MDSELINLRESVLSLTSELSKDDIGIKLLNIECMLTDYDFFEDSEEIVKLTPAQILDNYLETFYLEINSQRLYFEWFAVLALYWLNKIDELRLNKDRSLNYCYHAYNLAQSYLETANRLDEKIKQRKRVKNLAVSKSLSDKRYATRRRLKECAFKEYKCAYEQLERDGKRVTYRAIVYKVWRIIRYYNIDPVTGQKIIDGDTEHKFPDDVIRILIKWFSEGVRDKKLKSPRAK